MTNGFIVVTQVGMQMFGIVVDGVFHTEEIVVKPMSSKLRNIPVFSGNTILGDGSVILIIDPNGRRPHHRQARPAVQHLAEGSSSENEAAQVDAEIDAGVPRRLAAAERRFPLSLVTRARGDRREGDRVLDRPSALCNIAASLMPLVAGQTRTCASRARGLAAAPGLHRRGPLDGNSWSTRSSTSFEEKTRNIEGSRASVRGVLGLGRDQRPRPPRFIDHRALPAAGVRGLAALEGAGH